MSDDEHCKNCTNCQKPMHWLGYNEHGNYYCTDCKDKFHWCDLCEKVVSTENIYIDDVERERYCCIFCKPILHDFCEWCNVPMTKEDVDSYYCCLCVSCACIKDNC